MERKPCQKAKDAQECKVCESPAHFCAQGAQLESWIALHFHPVCIYCFPGGSAGKESSCSVGDLGLIPGWEDPLEKGTVTHSSILA